MHFVLQITLPVNRYNKEDQRRIIKERFFNEARHICTHGRAPPIEACSDDVMTQVR